MSGLGGLNKSPNGVVLGMVQLQLPVIETKADVTAQADRICAMVAKARNSMPGMDLVVFPEYSTMGIMYDPDEMMDTAATVPGDETAIFSAACREATVGAGRYRHPGLRRPQRIEACPDHLP